MNGTGTGGLKLWVLTICLLVGLIPVASLPARELKLSPPDGDTDAVPMLREALRQCREKGVRRLVLEPGTWHLHPERADGMFRHVSNHDPGYKRVAIPLKGFSNFEIDGQDATLICHGVLIPITIDSSKQVTVRNLTIDWDKPFHLEGTVTAVGEDFFDVDMLPECEVVLGDGKLFGGVAEGIYGSINDPGQARQDFRWNYWIDPETRAAAATQFWLAHWNRRTRSFAEVTGVGANRFRIRNAHTKTLPDEGAVMVCKGTHRRNRLSPAMHVTSSDGALVENITVHHAGGMGLIAEDCADPTVRNLRIVLKDNRRSLVTTTADATHFVGCRGLVTVEECLFENMLDDSCNVHGIYAIAEGLVAPDRLAVSFSHFQQLGTAFARPGDRLRLVRRDTLLGYADCTVTDITRHNHDYYVLALDKSIDGVYQENSSVENLYTRPGVIYRNNTVRNNRARGMLVTAGGKVLIENNRFERPSMMGILVEGDNHVWYESGAVEDVTIRGNTFIGHSTTAPLLKLAPMQPKEERLLRPYHHNIRILDNTIEAASPLVIEARRVRGLQFCGNTVTFRGEAADSAAPAFRLVACEEVLIRENELSRPATVEVIPADSSMRLENGETLRRTAPNE